jgi:hypothetical protein
MDTPRRATGGEMTDEVRLADEALAELEDRIAAHIAERDQ